MIIPLKVVILTDTTPWCKLPYPSHPNGCPNFGKKEGGPPSAPSFNDLVEFPCFLVYKQFDLEAQEKKLLAKHPKWSKRQARCCLYWQRGVVQDVMHEAIEFLCEKECTTGDTYEIVKNPEGAGVNLFKTCKIHGLELDRDYLNQKYVYKMVIVGKKKQ